MMRLGVSELIRVFSFGIVLGFIRLLGFMNYK